MNKIGMCWLYALLSIFSNPVYGNDPLVPLISSFTNYPLFNGTYQFTSALDHMRLQSCSGDAYVSPLSPTDPRFFQFTFMPALNNAQFAFSLTAKGLDGNLWLSVNPLGFLTFLQSPDPSDASFVVMPGLSDPTGYSFKSLSSNFNLLGTYIGVGDTLIGTCSSNFSAPAGSVTLVDGMNKNLATWYITFVPPKPTGRLWVPNYGPQMTGSNFTIWGKGGIAVTYHVVTFVCQGDNCPSYGNTPFISLSLTPSSSPWILGQGIFWLSDMGHSGCGNCNGRGGAIHPFMSWAVAVYECVTQGNGAGESTTIVTNITWTGEDLNTAVIGPSVYWGIGYGNAFFSPSGRFLVVTFWSQSGTQWCIFDGFPQQSPDSADCPAGDSFAWASNESFFVIQSSGTWDITLHRIPSKLSITLPATEGALLTTPAFPTALLIGSTLFPDPIKNSTGFVIIPALAVPGRTVLGWSPTGLFALVSDWNKHDPSCVCIVGIVGGNIDLFYWNTTPVLFLECSNADVTICGAQASWGTNGILLGPTLQDTSFARMYSQGEVEPSSPSPKMSVTPTSSATSSTTASSSSSPTIIPTFSSTASATSTTTTSSSPSSSSTLTNSSSSSSSAASTAFSPIARIAVSITSTILVIALIAVGLKWFTRYNPKRTQFYADSSDRNNEERSDPLLRVN